MGKIFQLGMEKKSQVRIDIELYIITNIKLQVNHNLTSSFYDNNYTNILDRTI